MCLPRMAERALFALLLTAALLASGQVRAQSSGCEDGEGRRSAEGGRPVPLRVYPHDKVMRYEFGEGPRSYWLFEPAEPRPEARTGGGLPARLVCREPGILWGVDRSSGPLRSVSDLPGYQNDVGTMPAEFLPNALAAIRDGLEVLDTGAKHVRPELHQVAVIGHSAGGNLAAQIAAVSADPHAGLPPIKVVVALMPGEVLPSREPKLDRIPASTLLLVAVGEDDLLVGDVRGRQIFTQTSAIPKSRKRFLLFRSDRHGFPPIIAEHTAPTGANRRLDTGEGLFRTFQMSLGEVNAMDRAGFWRIADATLDAAFAGRTFDDAIRDADQFTHLGYWSDGRKVNPPLISDNLSTIPRVNLPNGIRLIPWDVAIKLGESARVETGTRIK